MIGLTLQICVIRQVAITVMCDSSVVSVRRQWREHWQLARFLVLLGLRNRLRSLSYAESRAQAPTVEMK
jgi:hypothetical protein